VESVRWSTNLSSKVKLPDAINIAALCGADLVTQPPDIRGIKTLEVHRVGAGDAREDALLELFEEVVRDVHLHARLLRVFGF